MGQRSQIYVRYYEREADTEPKLIARYYQWNYGERMISRARYGIEWIKEYTDFAFELTRRLYRILDTNFDMVDVVISQDILEEVREDVHNGWTANTDEAIRNAMFHGQDNNDGQLLIDVQKSGDIKYAFVTHSYTGDGKVMSAKGYMAWNSGKNWRRETKYFDREDIETCEKNISYIQENATLMTKKEVRDFFNCDYRHVLGIERADEVEATA